MDFWGYVRKAFVVSVVTYKSDVKTNLTFEHGSTRNKKKNIFGTPNSVSVQKHPKHLHNQ